jgi:hypothetical protein
MENRSFIEEVVWMWQYLQLVKPTKALERGQKFHAYWWWLAKPKRWKCFVIRIRQGMVYLPAFELTKRMKHKDLLSFIEFSKLH